jgi:hypothetical protein
VRLFWLGVFALAGALPARAADLWGCEVLLCMSNPAGPTAVAPCVPPINKLWRHLAKGGRFPDCPQARAQADTLVRMRPALYGWCPKHLTRDNPGVPGQTVCLATQSIDVIVEGKLTSRIWIGITDTATGELTTWTEEVN